MGYRIQFSIADDTRATLDAGIDFAAGDVLSMRVKFPNITTPTTKTVLWANTAGTDQIAINNNSATGDYDYKVRIGGSWYDQNVSSDGLWDGEWHDIEITRSGSNFIFKVDTVTVTTIPATSGTFTVNEVGYDPVSGDSMGAEVEDMQISDSTYPVTEGSNVIWKDTSVDGVDITMTDAKLALLSTWEWIGDFVHINKQYSSQSGIVTEQRKEGTRRRTVCGYDMSDASIKNSGEENASVSAWNGDIETTMTPDDAGGVTVDCDDEIFTPITGTNIFIQTQKWVSWRTT